jgi:hypothetical protein
MKNTFNIQSNSEKDNDFYKKVKILLSFTIVIIILPSCSKQSKEGLYIGEEGSYIELKDDGSFFVKNISVDDGSFEAEDSKSKGGGLQLVGKYQFEEGGITFIFEGGRAVRAQTTGDTIFVGRGSSDKRWEYWQGGISGIIYEQKLAKVQSKVDELMNRTNTGDLLIEEVELQRIDLLLQENIISNEKADQQRKKIKMDFDNFLFQAVEYRQNGRIERLLKIGANVNAITKKKGYPGWTPLIFAVRDQKLELVQLLLENGANVKANNNSALSIAAANDKNGQLIQLLIEKGADVNAKDESGETPLVRAMYYNPNLEIIRLLIEKGADINAKGNNGETPLFNAINWGTADIFRLLIEKGADVNAKNNDGDTPLKFARRFGSQEYVSMLEAVGAEE